MFTRLLALGLLSALTCFCFLSPSAAEAQATRTWVSGVGDDANPCSRTAPCKTFAGAISKTAAGGEISVLDPGGYGAVTITKAMTISGDGTLAGILSSGTNGIIVNAGANDRVVIRGISIHGGNGGLNGIRFLAGESLIVENSTITRFTQSGIEMQHSGGGNLILRNVSINEVSTGVRVSGGPTRINASIFSSRINDAVVGVEAVSGFTTIANSELSQNAGIAVLAGITLVSGNLTSGTVSVEGSIFSQNGTAFQSNASATIRVSNNSIFDNLSAFGCGGGTIASASNNRSSGNVGGAGNCNPNATLTLQ